MTKYAKPSINRVPNRVKTPENDALDVGWAKGELADGRPYRMECWAQDQVTMVTFFFDPTGYEDLTGKFFADLLEAEGLVRFTTEQRGFTGARPWRDDAGQPMVSVNMVVGDASGIFAEVRVPLRPYPR